MLATVWFCLPQINLYVHTSTFHCEDAVSSIPVVDLVMGAIHLPTHYVMELLAILICLEIGFGYFATKLVIKTQTILSLSFIDGQVRARFQIEYGGSVMMATVTTARRTTGAKKTQE